MGLGLESSRTVRSLGGAATETESNESGQPEPWDELEGGGGGAYLCPGEALASLDLLRDDLSVWKVEREKRENLLVTGSSG